MGAILSGIKGFGQKFMQETAPKLFKETLPKLASGLRSKLSGIFAKEGAEVVKEGAETVVKEGAENVAKNAGKSAFLEGFKGKLGQVAAGAAIGGGVWGGVNIAGAEGEGLQKVGNGLSAMGEQATSLARLGKSVLGIGSSAVNGVSNVVESAQKGDLLGGIGNAVSGFLGNLSNMIPDNLKQFAVPAALVAGGLLFANSGIIGKVAIGAVALMALSANSGGIKDLANQLIPTGNSSVQSTAKSLAAGMQDTMDSTKALPVATSPESGTQEVVSTEMAMA